MSRYLGLLACWACSDVAPDLFGSFMYCYAVHPFMYFPKSQVAAVVMDKIEKLLMKIFWDTKEFLARA